jgi:hypothetical protein
MDGIGRELKPRPMDQAQKASDPLTGRWPTLLLAPPGHPLWRISANPLRLLLVQSDVNHLPGWATCRSQLVAYLLDAAP